MRIEGFPLVPKIYKPETQSITYFPNHRLRAAGLGQRQQRKGTGRWVSVGREMRDLPRQGGILCHSSYAPGIHTQGHGALWEWVTETGTVRWSVWPEGWPGQRGLGNEVLEELAGSRGLDRQEPRPVVGQCLHHPRARCHLKQRVAKVPAAWRVPKLKPGFQLRPDGTPTKHGGQERPQKGQDRRAQG